VDENFIVDQAAMQGVAGSGCFHMQHILDLGWFLKKCSTVKILKVLHLIRNV
jgi:hypothetical protein